MTPLPPMIEGVPLTHWLYYKYPAGSALYHYLKDVLGYKQARRFLNKGLLKRRHTRLDLPPSEPYAITCYSCGSELEVNQVYVYPDKHLACFARSLVDFEFSEVVDHDPQCFNIANS